MEGAYLEMLSPSGSSVVPLGRDKIAVGKAESNDASLPDDPLVSRLHAVFERYASGWCVRDVGSRNGTFLNGERIVGDRLLRPGDEIRIGKTRMIFKLPAYAGAPTATQSAQSAPPDLTRRERQILVALCRPVLGRGLLVEPASIKAIAAELVISESAVKKHLGRLYDKFGIREPDERRRGRLVSDAIGCGAVSLGDL